MAATSRTLLQAVHSYVTTPSTVAIKKDSGLKGYQKKQLISATRLLPEELRQLKARFKAKKDWMDILIQAVEKGSDALDGYVGELSQMDTQFILTLSQAVLRQRERSIKSVKATLEDANALVSKKGKGQQFQNVLAMLDWALKNGASKADISVLLSLTKAYDVSLRSSDMNQILPALTEAHRQAELSVKNMQTVLRSEPVGYLNLEKLEFTPVGTQRGELVHSVPLAPKEEVSVTHREWSHITEEFEKIVKDELEEFSERGVSEKTELAESKSTQDQHSMAFNTGVSVTGTYGSVTATATANLGINESSTESATESRNRSFEMTQKASSRSKKDHKITFRIASEAEKERIQVQKLVNTSTTKAARIDYFQMIRAWDVRLFRYGVRLTWDIIIPEPASDLLARMDELAQIKKDLGIPFEDFFTLKPDDLTATNYTGKAAQYATSVSTPPPAGNRIVAVTDNKDWSSTPNGYTTSFTIDISIPDGYAVSGNTLFTYFADHKSGTWGILVDDISSHPRNRIYSGGSSWGSENIPSISSWLNRDGVLKIFVLAWDIKHFAISIQAPCSPKPETWANWRMKTWSEIRAGAQALYYERRQTLKARVEELEDELSIEDALSLRRREREEVMKGVLRWLGIEGHEFYPAGAPEDISGQTGIYNPETGLLWSAYARNKFIAHGDKIRFLHQAVEWENVLYFLYPYFWIHPRRWQEKLYMHHPDSTHRAFLKAGSCRVVLTIRPGFEDAFLAFINSGDMNALPPSPYMEISAELQAYATTNYQGIPPANPIDNFRPLITWKQRKGWDDLRQLITLLERFKSARSRYPTQAEGLAVLGSYTDSIIPSIPSTDPWSNPYVYKWPGDHYEYDLYSSGSGVSPDPLGENLPITNWAEASLIGKWTEYTPTSALDIEYKEL